MPAIRNAAVCGIGASMLAALVLAQTPRKGVMVQGTPRNQSRIEAVETTRTMAVQQSTVALKPAPGGQAQSGLEAASTAQGFSPAPRLATAGQAIVEGGPNVDYPAAVPGNPWTGGKGAVPELEDLIQGMTKLTGITPPSLPPQDPVAVCKCCSAALTMVQKDVAVPTETAANVYIAYQIWHVDHFSGNIFRSYSHSSNTCVMILLGDKYGTPLPPGAPPIPMVYSGTWGCGVPSGIEVPVDEGPAMPDLTSFPAPNVCPVCGRNDDTWNTYLLYTGKIMVQLAWPDVAPDLKKWVTQCVNGHDQAMPCSPFTESSSDECKMPTCPESVCPAEWEAYRACVERWRQTHGAAPQ